MKEFVIPGRLAEPNPESRCEGLPRFRACVLRTHPGMTQNNKPRF